MATTKIDPAPLTRPLYEIAAEIQADYRAKGKPVHYSAAPYVEAMAELDGWETTYFEDSAVDVVRYAVSNLGTWRGETATRVKAELKAALADHDQKRSRAHHPAGRRRATAGRGQGGLW